MKKTTVKNTAVYGYKKLTKRIPIILIRKILTFDLVKYILEGLGIHNKIIVAIVLFLLI
jgi:hypothetical protein